MQCPWCGVERDAPAVGPHVCSPDRVHERTMDLVVSELRAAREEAGHTAGWYDAFGVAIDVVKGTRRRPAQPPRESK